MLYSENELKKRLKTDCAVYYFYAGDEALVRSAAAKAEKELSRQDPETTVLEGPTPSVEEIVLAAGTISFFGGKRLVLMPLVRPSAYSDKDLQEFCDTLADTDNAVFILTSVMEEKYGKLRPGKREQKLISACEKLGYCAQVAKPNRQALQALARDWAQESGTRFAPGAEGMLLDRCGEDQFLLRSEIDKLAALSGYGTITPQMIEQLGTVTLEADTFDMVKLVASGRTRQALDKLAALLALQNDPILITGALVSNYLDVYRAFLTRRSRRALPDMAKDFGYTGKWNYRLGNAEQMSSRYDRRGLEQCLQVLQKLDLDLKGSRLPADILLQKAICEMGMLTGGRQL